MFTFKLSCCQSELVEDGFSLEQRVRQAQTDTSKESNFYNF
jgi:hypothetical protein